MKREKVECNGCGIKTLEKYIFKLSWRYTDKIHVYKGSSRKWLNTGYTFFCRKCLNKFKNQ